MSESLPNTPSHLTQIETTRSTDGGRRVNRKEETTGTVDLYLPPPSTLIYKRRMNRQGASRQSRGIRSDAGVRSRQTKLKEPSFPEAKPDHTGTELISSLTL
ncbi:hypothetical protein F2Q68_00024395 [Brassica cretica]|uniref:Uncharacterized protein n=1 Tax=Brassica cretica TaxID=69181 RepID=A0A8S9IAF5_BRACR|nr:hypothetical protein F2Q68_00024395 [Brassica cretica]